MPSWHLDIANDLTMSGVACHQSSRAENMIGRRWVWPAIIDLGQHTQSDDIGRGMPSWTLDKTHGRMTSSEA